MTPADAKRHAKKAVAAGEVGFTKHALQRMRERHINDAQILSVLRSGTVVEGPYQQLPNPDWRCEFEWCHSGDVIHVTAAFDGDSKKDVMPVIVITTLKRFRR